MISIENYMCNQLNVAIIKQMYEIYVFKNVELAIMRNRDFWKGDK